MNRFVIIAAYAANILLILAAGIIAIKAYGDDAYFALLLLVPPVLSIIALRRGPDAEERTLTRQVNKARLRRELAELGGDK